MRRKISIRRRLILVRAAPEVMQRTPISSPLHRRHYLFVPMVDLKISKIRMVFILVNCPSSVSSGIVKLDLPNNPDYFRYFLCWFTCVVSPVVSIFQSLHSCCCCYLYRYVGIPTGVLTTAISRESSESNRIPSTCTRCPAGPVKVAKSSFRACMAYETHAVIVLMGVIYGK